MKHLLRTTYRRTNNPADKANWRVSFKMGKYDACSYHHSFTAAQKKARKVSGIVEIKRPIMSGDYSGGVQDGYGWEEYKGIK